jgi:transcriptional regulator with XRE-family HTH domain
MDNQIRAIRQERGYTQQELADVLMTTKQAISNYELGKHEMPYGLLIRLADLLDVTVDELTAALDSNPLKAKQTYQDAHIRLTGVLNNIDSSGNYFNVNNGDQYSFDSVYCSILDDATLDKVASSSIGDTLVVCGTVTDVGEVLGYYVDVDYIE